LACGDSLSARRSTSFASGDALGVEPAYTECRELHFAPASDMVKV
jgi:hypothetical protein